MRVTKANALPRFATLVASAALTLGLSVALATPARAQFSTLSLPSAKSESATATAASGKKGNAIYSIGLYPYASFKTGIKISARDEATGESFTADSQVTTRGYLLAPEVVFPSANGKGGFGVGGWYWLAGEKQSETNDYFNLHAKYFFNSQIAVQVGYLGNTSVPSGGVKEEGFNFYGSYNYSGGATEKKPYDPYSVSAGLGVQLLNKQSVAGGAQSENGFDLKGAALLAYYVSGSYRFTQNFRVDLSFWGLNGKQDVDLGIAGLKTDVTRNYGRFAIGVGYEF
jgi:hypothetical protein